jgi:regulator of nucleoside diphosphate kinase
MTIGNDAICLTELDLVRLSRVAQELRSRQLQAPAANLIEMLAVARVVRAEEIPPHVVTMNSHVVIEEVKTGELRDFTLVYPVDADPARRKLSVLSPVGIAVLGLAAGDETNLSTPYGEKLRIRVARILYQPEAEGHLTV